MDRLRRLIASPAGKFVAIIVSSLLTVLAVYTVIAYAKGDTPQTAFYTTYICTETGKPFRHKNRIGETQPIRSPYSGKNTGVPAEACYWTADGSIKKQPTWVLLNESSGKPGPTFCPDCGRLVVGHNPPPRPGAIPPPTRQVYYAAR